MEAKLRSQTEWGWNIAAYLFLAGVGAGAYAVGIMADYAGRWPGVAQAGVILGFLPVLIGTLFLIADLGVKGRALRVFMNPGTSWISRGTFIISAFMILGAIHFALEIWPLQKMSVPPAAHRLLGGVNLVFALLTMIYTGVLLGASKPIALWSTAMLPVVFLVSALSTGAMAIVLLLSGLRLAGAEADPRAVAGLARADAILLLAEALVIALYLQGTHRSPESKAATLLILKGRLAACFWFGVVTLGLAVPFVLGVVEFRLARAGHETGAASSWLGVLYPVCGLFGGLVLRYVVLAGGVRAPLNAGGISYSFPTPVLPMEHVGPGR